MDVLIGQQEEIVVDQTTGLIQKIETVTVAAKDEYGNVVMRQERRAVAARVLPPSIQRGPPPRRALTHSVRDSPPRRYTRREDWKGMKLFKLCLLPFFIPYSRKWMVALQLVVVACVFTGIVFVGVGPIHSCAGSFYISASVLILVIFGLILCLSLACCCFACHTDSGEIMEIKHPGANGRDCQVCWLFIAWLFGMMFFILVVLETAFVFSNFDKFGHQQSSNNITFLQSYNYSSTLQQNLTGSAVGDCKFGESLIGGLCFSYTLILFFSFYWCVIFKNIYDEW